MKFDWSVKKQIGSPKKVYFIDNAINKLEKYGKVVKVNERKLFNTKDTMF